MAKGIGIILVVHGHSCGTIVEHIFIGAFHMPLFFFLSGLFLFRKDMPLKEFIRQKGKTLLFPCLIFGIILSSYSTVIDILRNNSSIPYGMRYIGLFINTRHNPFPGSLWFFPCLFLIEMFLYQLYKICNKKIHLVVGATILATIGLLIHYYYGKGLPWSLDIALYCTVFTTIGYYFSNTIWKDRNLITYLLALLIFLGSVYVNYLCSGEIVDLHSCKLGNYMLFYISAFSGIYLTIGLSKVLKDNMLLQYYGQNSLLVYALQFLFLLVVNLLLRWIPFGWLGGIIQTSIILIILIPIINVINSHFKWMAGKF